MKLFSSLVLKETKKFIAKQEKKHRAAIDRILDLFDGYGTYLPNKYLKKISKTIWELRPGEIRLLLGIIGNIGIVVHGLKKKTNKLPRRDIKLAEQRFKRWQNEKH